ncbi:MAG: GNAT family N-acetyltransferase [Chloroflexi bacterium]|nr:GNAT family N-acetyltransferase [Chloroflexota bacterium]
MTIPPLCELLPWDTEFFGRRIARVNTATVTPESLAQITTWCRDQAVECLYVLADPNDRETLRLLGAPIFRLVDMRVTFERKPPAVAAADATALPEGLRPWREDDLPALRTMASRSYTDSRFYFDGHFPTQLCDAFYATWIERSCQGYADAVLVAEADDQAQRQPAAFITCHLHPAKDATEGQIGLVGVAENARGRGLGGQVVAAALNWFAGQGCARVTVVTQGRNLAAQRLYQRNGFLTESIKLWYHGWFDAEGMPS